MRTILIVGLLLVTGCVSTQEYAQHQCQAYGFSPADPRFPYLHYDGIREPQGPGKPVAE